MDRLVDEIAPSCAVTPLRSPNINRSSVPYRALVAISEISPPSSQRVLKLGHLIEVASPVIAKLHAKRIKLAEQSPISI